MSGPLFAISELFIVAAAIWCTYKLSQRAMWLAAIGSAVLGAIAALGAYRYGLNQVTELAALHKGASQIGGAIAIILIGGQFLLLFPWVKQYTFRKASVAVAIIGSILAIVTLPLVAVAVVIIWILVPILVTACGQYDRLRTRFHLIALISIFLLNFLIVRQSTVLGPIYSWHVYHTLIAIWLIALVYVLNRCMQRV